VTTARNRLTAAQRRLLAAMRRNTRFFNRRLRSEDRAAFRAACAALRKRLRQVAAFERRSREANPIVK